MSTLLLEQIDVVRMRPKAGGPWCYMEPCEVDDMLDGSSRDDYEIDVAAMTAEQYERLPEFEGW